MPAARETAFPATPPTIGGGRVLPSPSQFYLTGEDRLRIVSANSVTGVALKLQVRTAQPDGSIQAQSFDHVPLATRAVRTEDFSIGAGSVLNVTVFAGAGAPEIGQTYVMVQLVRGTGVAAIVLGTLLGGYVTGTQAMGFPGSPIEDSFRGNGCLRVIQGTQPAAGFDVSENVPTGARWDLISLLVKLTASATVANRLIRVNLGTSTFYTWHTTTNTPIAAGGVGTFVLGQSVTELGNVYAAGRFEMDELPIGMFLFPAGGFTTTTDNLQVGDQWSAPIFLVREWLQVR